MVVLDDDAPEDLLDRDFAFDVGLAAQVPADIIPTTKTPFLQRKGRLYTMAGHVHRDGKLVYGSLR